MSFPKMVEVVPEGSHGEAKIVHFEINREDAMFSAMRGEYILPGQYAKLVVDGRLWMSDTRMERSVIMRW